MARLKEQYVNEIAPALNSKFGYKSVMQIPKLDKVVMIKRRCYWRSHCCIEDF